MTAKRTNEDWLKLVSEQRSSGLTIEAWCSENSVNLHTMADRISRLRKAGLIKEPKPAGGRHCERRTKTELREWERSENVKWVEVSEEASEANTAETEAEAEPAPAGIQVEIGQFKIAVEAEFSEAVFMQVCRALAAIC